MAELPRACPSLFAALDWYRHGTVVRTRQAMVQPLSQHYWPTTVVTLADGLPDDAIAVVCQGLTCLEPATCLEMIQQQVSQSR
jgi:uncharacterized protein YyaL (SSP411 family)